MSDPNEELPAEAPVEATGQSCEVETSPFPRREGFTPPTEEEIRRDAGLTEPADDTTPDAG